MSTKICLFFLRVLKQMIYIFSWVLFSIFIQRIIISKPSFLKARILFVHRHQLHKLLMAMFT